MSDLVLWRGAGGVTWRWQWWWRQVCGERGDRDEPPQIPRIPPCSPTHLLAAFPSGSSCIWLLGDFSGSPCGFSLIVTAASDPPIGDTPQNVPSWLTCASGAAGSGLVALGSIRTRWGAGCPWWGAGAVAGGPGKEHREKHSWITLHSCMYMHIRMNVKPQLGRKSTAGCLRHRWVLTDWCVAVVQLHCCSIAQLDCGNTSGM